MKALACVGAGLLSITLSAAAETPASPYIVIFAAEAIAAAPGPQWPGSGDHGRPEVRAAAERLASLHGFSLGYVYSHAVEGFSAHLNGRQLAALSADLQVAYIEADLPMSVMGAPAQVPGARARPERGGGGSTAPAAQALPWGIDRVEADLSSTRAGDGSGSVTGVHAYIIDTGIDTSHADLYVVDHVNFAGGPNKDCHGHGTHVAGTVGAIDNAQDVVGMAPEIELVGVKVLGCGGTGSTSGVIAGVDWVTANAVLPAVANMSLGGGASTALDTAVLNSAAAGIFYAVAAGNDGGDACLGSPARAGEGSNGVMTTAAIGSTGQEASFSNYGNCVDIWAPGVGVLSTQKGGGTTTYSGTSMASPHTAGAGALYLSTAGSGLALDAAAVEAALYDQTLSLETLSKDERPIELLQVDRF
ncbi:S8 family serine peptidase [Pseudomonas sp. SA3-5]|uniref:S8 family serine peptidase n=1 Tax=Pseudomonas aestuarii TaxID=3018340 RepID=A0ABT4XL80_9PSED|nr:S8 family peptidase [Pseudomonas aestuarii]MDA7088932.1 S8 family serine peptidase [Pseudomonas aestuarii]